MAEGVPAYLRIRVINRDPKFYFADGFENTAGMTSTLWHSLGNEAGTDNSLNYWNQVAGTWTLTTHVLTNTSGAANDLIVGGHADWTDMTFTVRFKWVTAGQIRPLIHCDGTAANFIFAAIDGANLRLFKMVGSVATQIATTPAALVNTTFYWGEVVALGTTYTVNLYADATGVKSTLIATTSGTIADAGVQSGVVGIQSATATAWIIAGNSPNMCTVTGTGPDGTQGQAWTPVVTTGEPAFAWSKASPYAGTYTASIYNRNAAGNGAWQQTIRLFSGSSVTLSAQSKASAGTANVTAGGLTSGNAGTSYGALTAVGAITTNPTVSCNYTGAIGTAYFDALSILNPAYEITTDLPHLHTTHIDVNGMIPGNPSSSAIGGYTVNLHPPFSPGYAAAKAVYDQLDYYHRLEFYISHDGSSLGKLYSAGPITGIDKQDGSFTLTGASDLQYANLSKPFPGEVLFLAYGGGPTTASSYRQARNYFGTNEPGASDSFSTYTAANYTSTARPSLAAGTWAATTDDGLNVVSCSTGTGAILISKTGASAGDSAHRHYVEISGRLLPSADATNAGVVGVGLTAANTDANNSMVAMARAKKNGTSGRWDIDVLFVSYAGGSIFGNTTYSSVLSSADDPEGYIPLTIGLSIQGTTNAFEQYVQITVNGTKAIPVPGVITSIDFGTPTCFPFLAFSTPNTGSATGYLNNLVHMVRYTDDLHPNAAAFKSGSIGSPAFSLPYATDPGPTFLEIWARAATREGWYWRYTPKAYVVGTRTLGTIDLTTDPGTDLGTAKQVVFDRVVASNLQSLTLSANADQFASSATGTSISGTDGGGIAHWADITAMTKYGVIEDQMLILTASNFAEQRPGIRKVVANRTVINAAATTPGSKTAVVLRDPQTVDKWRELDKAMVHDPEFNLNNLVARIVSYTFDEGQGTQTITLDQFGPDHMAAVSPRRLQQGIFQIAAKFGNR